MHHKIRSVRFGARQDADENIVNTFNEALRNHVKFKFRYCRRWFIYLELIAEASIECKYDHSPNSWLTNYPSDKSHKQEFLNISVP